MKADLHVHTYYSYDAINDIHDIIRYAKRRGLDAIAITDHDRIEAAIMYSTMIDEIVIIPGIELSSPYGHILLLNVKKIPPYTNDLNQLREYVDRENGILVLAHPFGFLKRGKLMELILRNVHAIEVANAHDFNIKRNYNELLKLSQRFNLGITAGSDSHIPDTIGYAYLEAEAEDIDGLIDAIIKRKCDVYYKRVSTYLRVKKLFYDILHRAKLYRPQPPLNK